MRCKRNRYFFSSFPRQPGLIGDRISKVGAVSTVGGRAVRFVPKRIVLISFLTRPLLDRGGVAGVYNPMFTEPTPSPPTYPLCRFPMPFPAKFPLRTYVFLLVGGWCLFSQTGQASQAKQCAPSVRLQDEIVEINTRGACCTTDPSQFAATIVVKEYVVNGEQGGRRWIDSDFSRLTQPTAEGMTTVVYVHGNQVTHSMTRRRSLDLYRKLAANACDDRPIRFVIWSWPATEIKGILKDYRVKAARTRPIGWELAWALDQLPPESPVGLLGYSYGARIIGGAMHVLAGGDLSGLSLPEPVHPNRPAMRVAFIEAATHAHWFGPGRYHGLAMEQINQLLLVVNHLDPAMRLYHMTSGNSRPNAMGHSGPACLTAESRERVTCLRASRCVGRTHDLYEYMSKRSIMTPIWRHLTYVEEPAMVPVVISSGNSSVNAAPSLPTEPAAAPILISSP